MVKFNWNDVKYDMVMYSVLPLNTIVTQNASNERKLFEEKKLEEETVFTFFDIEEIGKELVKKSCDKLSGESVKKDEEISKIKSNIREIESKIEAEKELETEEGEKIEKSEDEKKLKSLQKLLDDVSGERKDIRSKIEKRGKTIEKITNISANIRKLEETLDQKKEKFNEEQVKEDEKEIKELKKEIEDIEESLSKKREELLKIGRVAEKIIKKKSEEILKHIPPKLRKDKNILKFLKPFKNNIMKSNEENRGKIITGLINIKSGDLFDKIADLVSNNSNTKAIVIKSMTNLIKGKNTNFDDLNKKIEDRFVWHIMYGNTKYNDTSKKNVKIGDEMNYPVTMKTLNNRISLAKDIINDSDFSDTMKNNQINKPPSLFAKTFREVILNHSKSFKNINKENYKKDILNHLKLIEENKDEKKENK